MQNELMHSRRFGTFLVERQEGRVVVNGWDHMIVYEARNIRMAQ